MTVPHSSSSQRCVAVVTGAASGIGAALTRSLLARGSTVIAIEHVARAMQNAETAESFAERVLDVLQAGDAPFYWLTHPESRPWIDARHRTIEQSRPPFSDFGAAP